MFVHAVCDLKEGEEITLTYCEPNTSLKERIKMLKSWKVTCDCRLCKLDRTDPFIEEREKLNEQFEEIKYA